ncbi:hypothetical protein [Streptomyces racemochromogenes]|uniref:hypothetical protein n=1 Tax=Streptomyces racemochromogenes TaxID=67353 RepID=UPI0035ED6C6D
MTAGTTAARRAKKQARLSAAVPAQPKKARKAKKPKVARATVAALRGQIPPGHLSAELEAASVAAVPNPRLRWAAFNGSAAVVGHGIVWGVTGNPWAGAGLMGDVMVSLVPVGTFVVTVGAAVTAGYAGYKARRILGPLSPAAAPAAAIGAAFWGQGTGDLISAFLERFAPWPVALAPLVIAGTAGYGVWFALERPARARGWDRARRWLVRIPLATLTISALLYAPGALL